MRTDNTDIPLKSPKPPNTPNLMSKYFAKSLNPIKLCHIATLLQCGLREGLLQSRNTL
jgi:hypothetical protein